MTGFVPDLDDVEFEALVEEARGMIPEIAPDWTDHNLHDPGITVIDLLAWLVDQQVYRIGFVGPSLRAAFSRLLGISARPARQAIFDVWPEGTREKKPALDLEAGTLVHSDDLPDGRFMVAEATRLTGARIVDVRQITGDRSKSLGLGLTEGRSTLTLPPADGGGPFALELAFDQPLSVEGGGPVVLGIQVANGQPAEGARTDVPWPLADGTFAFHAASTNWDPVRIEERLPGGEGWRALDVTDRTGGMTRSGVIRLHPVDTSGNTVIRLRFADSFRPGTVTLARLGVDVVSVVEGWRDVEEVIGVGNGQPDQSFDFPSNDIAGGTEWLSLVSGTSDGRRDWSLVEDFAVSGPGDLNAQIVAETGRVRFGNGVNGRVLEPGEQLSHLPLIRTEGNSGNVARGLRWTVAGVPIGTNLDAGTGGRDADKLDDLIARARAAVAVRHGALQADTVKEIVERSGLGLARVEVLSRYRPGAATNGARTVLIIPARAPDTLPGPPRIDVIQAVKALLDPARLLGERVFISTPVYVPLDLDVTLVVAADADPSVREAFETHLRERLSDIPVTDGVPPWPPGRDLSIGDLRELAGQLGDVWHLENVRIAPVDGRALNNGVLALEARELPLLRTLSVRVRPVGGAP